MYRILEVRDIDNRPIFYPQVWIGFWFTMRQNRSFDKIRFNNLVQCEIFLFGVLHNKSKVVIHKYFNKKD